MTTLAQLSKQSFQKAPKVDVYAVVKALQRLGNSEQEFIRQLKTLNIQGVSSSPSQCVLAEYLKREFPDADVQVNSSTSILVNDAYITTLSKANEHANAVALEPKLQRIVSTVIEKFDYAGDEADTYCTLVKRIDHEIMDLQQQIKACKIKLQLLDTSDSQSIKIWKTRLKNYQEFLTMYTKQKNDLRKDFFKRNKYYAPLIKLEISD